MFASRPTYNGYLSRPGALNLCLCLMTTSWLGLPAADELQCTVPEMQDLVSADDVHLVLTYLIRVRAWVHETCLRQHVSDAGWESCNSIHPILGPTEPM